MFIEQLENLLKSEELHSVAINNFKNTLLNWRKENPEEVTEILESEFNADGLTFVSLNVSKANKSNYKYEIEATYCKTFSNNLKVIYILKFWDDFTIYDDVLYVK
ncbi:MAG: hypothetical protein J6B80_04385 [Clostridia bacterium]|nr:hypothetical protein [Clostridia bacterium]